MGELVVPAANAKDNDDVVVALETARVSEERGDLESASKWLHRAAAAARHQGKPERAGSLSRAAARLSRFGEKFEKAPDSVQVLSDIEDDESDKTIVELSPKSSSGADEEQVRSSKRESKAKKVADGGEVLVEKPTPIAPLSAQPRAAAHHAIRVGVKRTLGGNFEARPLSEGEEALPGEQEALLVPTQTSSPLR